MYSVYTVPIDQHTYVMNGRLAAFVAKHMAKPYFTDKYVEMYSRAVVCQEDGEIIGCALIRHLTSEEGDEELNIECFCVREKSRNCGVGTDMLQCAVENTTPEMPVLWVDKGSRCDDLRRLYQSNGFEVVLDREKDFKMRLRGV